MDMIQHTLAERTVMARHQQEDSDVIDLARLGSVLWQAKWNIVALVIIVCMLAVVAVLNITPAYNASATLLIEEKNPPVLSFQQSYDPTDNSSEYIQTQLGLLQSRALAERVVKGLSLTTNPYFDPRQQPKPMFDLRSLLHMAHVDEFIPSLAPKEKPALTDDEVFNIVTHNLTDVIAAQMIGKSQLVAVGVQMPTAELAADTANALAKGFIESQLDANLNTSLATTSWMNSRMDELRTKLRDAEATLQAYREAQGLVDVDGVATIKANELSMTGNRMIDARSQRAEAESQYRQVQAMKNGGLDRLSSVPAVLAHPLIQQFKGDQAKAQAKVDELSRRYGDKHPAMIAARSDLAAATAALDTQVGLVVAGIERNYQLAQANESSISQSFNKNKEQIQDISRKEFKLRELQREVDSNRVLYETFLTRLKETAATADINTTNARIVDLAIPPLKPAKPAKGLIVGIAGVLAAVLGIGMTLLFDAMNNTFKNAEDVESKLNMPVLGIVPLVPKRNRKQVAHIYEKGENQQFCEAIRTLRTSLVLSAIDTPRPVVLVTSSVPGEGKSSIATNLAFSLASIERVLLIDADLRQPTMARNFEFPAGTLGLANLIAGTAELDDCIRTVGNVDLLPAGMVPPNPQELLSSPRLTKALEELKSRYQRIIIDSPPTQAVSDSMLLATSANALIYVVRAENTSIPLVQKGIGQLLQNNAPVMGVVLNQVDLNKSRNSGYNYASYYRDYGKAPKASS